MNDYESMIAAQNDEGIKWNYAPPPTPYDHVRDNIITKIVRLGIHSVIHPFIRSYNKLNVINCEAVLDNWPFIITPNHSSHMDTMAMYSAFPLKYVNRLFSVAAKDYFFRNSSIALGSRLIANIIPLDRTGTEKEGLQLSFSKIREGHSILIFPEGTRSVTGELGRFKKGAILLSKEAKIPIIPAYIKGTFQSMPKAARFPIPARITILFGDPLYYWKSSLYKMENIEASHHLEQSVRELKQTLEKME